MAELPGAVPTERGSIEGFGLDRGGWTALLAAAGVAWCAALLLWAQHGVDEAMALWSSGLDQNGLAIGLAHLTSQYGKPVMGVILLAGLIASLRVESWRPLRPVFLLTVLSLALSGVAGDVLKEIVDRPRPAVAHPELSFATGESKTWSFPSGHSTKAVALALPFLLFVGGWSGWRGFVKCALAALALAVCASRVVLGAHYLSDVVGGLAMALGGLPLAVLATNALLRGMTPSDVDRAARIGIAVYAVLIFVLWMLS